MATEPQPQPDYFIRLRPLRDSAPPVIRLRRWLKIGLRAFGLRCVSVVEVAKVEVAKEKPADVTPVSNPGGDH